MNIDYGLDARPVGKMTPFIKGTITQYKRKCKKCKKNFYGGSGGKYCLIHKKV